MNKSLLPVGDKPAIARIIDSYPPDAEFVITLGYRGDAVRQFLQIAYPDRAFDFVQVKNFEGPGSSLAHSMLCAKDFLNQPFVYNAGDSIWTGNGITRIDRDALAGIPGGDTNLYASFNLAGDKVSQIHGKRMTVFDLAYIGVATIRSHASFWARLEDRYRSFPDNQELNDLSAIGAMLSEGLSLFFLEVESWHDIGSVSGLNEAEKAFGSDLKTLQKEDEAIFRCGDLVMKYFADAEIVANRVSRARLLSPHVPTVRQSGENWYSYDFIAGETLSKTVSLLRFAELLAWAQDSIWESDSSPSDVGDFESLCAAFYIDKSQQRVRQFTTKTLLKDKSETINGLTVPPASEMLSLVSRSKLLVGSAGQFHGDFVLDNILDLGDKFMAIDWRQSFGGSLSQGDVHYDLAKLNHSLTMDHDLLNSGQFILEFKEGQILAEMLRRQILVECEGILKDFCLGNGYDFRTVQILTPIIWINMAPLHQHPIGEFLYYYGRYRLWSFLRTLEA